MLCELLSAFDPNKINMTKKKIIVLNRQGGVAWKNPHWCPNNSQQTPIPAAELPDLAQRISTLILCFFTSKVRDRKPVSALSW